MSSVSTRGPLRRPALKMSAFADSRYARYSARKNSEDFEAPSDNSELNKIFVSLIEEERLEEALQLKSVFEVRRMMKFISGATRSETQRGGI